MKRITVFEKGKKSNGGKTLLINNDTDTDINKLLERICMKLNIELNLNVRTLYTKYDGEIDDVSLIRDNDVLYVLNSNEESNESDDELRIQHHCKCCKYNVNDDRGQLMSSGSGSSNWIKLNVGGKCFVTTRSTLCEREPNSMLARMFNVTSQLKASELDSNGSYLIDRSPKYFEIILNYLRNGCIIYNNKTQDDLNGILIECKYYNIETMIPQIEELIHKHNEFEQMKLNEHINKNEPSNIILTRYDIIKTLINTSYVQELRFQGVHLTGANLTKLDLRNINFKYSILTHCIFNGANLSFCCFERADLSNSNLENVQLLGVKALCANFENCNLKNSNFEDPTGIRANLEGCNLKNAILEGSNMAGVNLRVATLKRANLKNCDLRSAVLAGADLEWCDLSGSDLQEANLRGANLKNALFELMLTPLHMSQTIR